MKKFNFHKFTRFKNREDQSCVNCGLLMTKHNNYDNCSDKLRWIYLEKKRFKIKTGDDFRKILKQANEKFPNG